MFKYNKDVIPTDCEPGVTRKILCYSDDLMMCEISFKKGSKGNFHKHEHLQITYIAKGSFEFTIGGETKIVNQGDSVYMPSNVEHGVTALEDGILVDVFNPMRKYFLKKTPGAQTPGIFNFITFCYIFSDTLNNNAAYLFIFTLSIPKNASCPILLTLLGTFISLIPLSAKTP